MQVTVLVSDIDMSDYGASYMRPGYLNKRSRAFKSHKQNVGFFIFFFFFFSEKENESNPCKPNLSPLRGSLTSTFLSKSLDQRPVDYKK